MRRYKGAILTVAVLTAAVLAVSLIYTVVNYFRREGVLITYSHASSVESAEQRPININTATAKQLMSLDGIGEVRAKAIIDYREEHGRFESVDEILNVKGFGEVLLESIRQDICV